MRRGVRAVEHINSESNPNPDAKPDIGGGRSKRPSVLKKVSNGRGTASSPNPNDWKASIGREFVASPVRLPVRLVFSVRMPRGMRPPHGSVLFVIKIG